MQCSVLSCLFRVDAGGVETLFSVYRIYGKQELQPRCQWQLVPCCLCSIHTGWTLAGKSSSKETNPGWWQPKPQLQDLQGFKPKLKCNSSATPSKRVKSAENLPQVTAFYILDFTPTKWIWSCGNEAGDWYTHDGRKQVVGRCCCPILFQRVDAIEWSVYGAWADLRWDPVRSKDHKKQMQAEGWTITGIVQDPIHLGCWHIDASRWESLGSNRKCSCGYPKT